MIHCNILFQLSRQAIIAQAITQALGIPPRRQTFGADATPVSGDGIPLQQDKDWALELHTFLLFS